MPHAERIHTRGGLMVLAGLFAAVTLFIGAQPWLEGVIVGISEDAGHTVQNCVASDGELTVVSHGLFSRSNRTVCLMPDGSTFTVFPASSK